MANEVSVTMQLGIRKVPQQYNSLPTSFIGSIAAALPNGPSPGTITATPAGTIVTFPQLKLPGYYRVQNLDPPGAAAPSGAPKYVEIGAWNGVDFFPLNELLPGETYVGRFSRNIGQEYIGTASSTTHIGAKEVMVKSHGGSTNVLVEAFDA